MLAGGKTNSFSKRKLSLILSTLGAVLYFDIMALTMSSSHSESEGYSNDNVLLPEEIFTISMSFVLNTATSVCLLLINPPSAE